MSAGTLGKRVSCDQRPESVSEFGTLAQRNGVPAQVCSVGVSELTTDSH